MAKGNPDSEKYKHIKKAVETHIGVPVSDIRKMASAEDMYNAKIIQMVKKLELLRDRDQKMIVELNLDFQSSYNIPFYDLIDSLLELAFPDDEVRQLLYFYVYKRFDTTGEVIPIQINGQEFILLGPMQLVGAIEYLESLYALE